MLLPRGVVSAKVPLPCGLAYKEFPRCHLRSGLVSNTKFISVPINYIEVYSAFFFTSGLEEAAVLWSSIHDDVAKD